jgi:hypothetical protein
VLVLLGQHNHDQCVGDDGDHQQEGHHIAVHGLCVADGQLARHSQVQNACVVTERSSPSHMLEQLPAILCATHCITICKQKATYSGNCS